MLDGVDLCELAETHGTPLWAVSRAVLEANWDRLSSVYRARYPRCEVAYSVKVNNNRAIIELLHQRGALMDCSAEYEVHLALNAGVPADKVILNGNGKSDAALRLAATEGIRQVNIDSLEEVARLDRIAREAQTTVRCLIRLQLDYSELLAADPAYESTLTLGEGKFGVSVPSGQADLAVAAVLASPNLELLGFHHHTGFSGYVPGYHPDKELMHHRWCAAAVCAFAKHVRERHGYSATHLDLGGGCRATSHMLLSTPGAEDEEIAPIPTTEAYADAVFGAVEAAFAEDEPPTVQFETGSYHATDAVILLTTVAESKLVSTTPPRRFITIDASSMMFVDRLMTRYAYPVVALRAPDAVGLPLVTELVGQTCVWDSIARDVRLPELQVGDTLALLHQGAYCDTLSTQFNAFPRPAVVLLDRGTVTSIKRRETLDDICARELSLAAHATKGADDDDV